MMHKFEKFGKKIVIDTNSSSVYVVDDVVYEILDFYTPGCNKNSSWFCTLAKKYGENEVSEAFDEIQKLEKNSQLFAKDININNIKIESPIKAMCLNVAHDCQLRCKYCFASQGDFGGQRMLMSDKTAKNAIDFLILNSGKRKNLEIDFFGGEPMMNFEVIKKTIEYAKINAKIFDKNFRFTITTNGLGLDDEKIDFLNQEMSNIVMSLDGRKNINDSMRITANGLGCYDIIVNNFKKIVKKRGKKDYYIRGTFTKKNLDFTQDVIALYNLGFKKISLEPAVIDENTDYALNFEDIEKIKHEYDKLASWVINTKKIDPDFVFFHFNINLENSPCLTKKIKGCGCGNDYIAVTPNGDIFPCHQFVGKNEFLMGNVNNNLFSKSIKSKCIKNLQNTLKLCKNCTAKAFCSPCLARSKFTSELGCKISRSRVESALGTLIPE
ncbi:MAG: thioether cross-link-forming SCIFF peptide maturase [Clostridia bacterium]|nr:thioether cross-link-forming SCIFF peptide maturase [Clostridia bacterium]